MIEPKAFAFMFLFSCIGMMAIWNNWIWVGKDGYNLSNDLRPGFFRFWLVITPKFLLGMKTGMESITLQSRNY